MVRTFLCHPFVEPKAFADNFEPTAVCFMQNDCMVISSSTGSIQIYDLKQEGHPQLHSFPSIGIPVDFLFSDNKQFLVSLETRIYDYKPLKSQRDLNCQVYIYWNFHCDINLKVPCLVHTEYTKNIKGSAIGTYVNKFPVIDIGIHDPVTDIALCKINDNIALSARNKVFIFVFKEIDYQQSNVDQIRLIDFFKIIEVDTSFHVRSISISNNYLAFASRRELRVVQIYLSHPEGEDGSLMLETCMIRDESTNISDVKHARKPSNVTDNVMLDDDFIVWSFNQCNNVSTSFSSGKSYPNKVDGQCCASTIRLNAVKKEPPYTDGSLNAKEIIGPVEDMVGHPFAISLVDALTNIDIKGTYFKGSVSAVTLLYRRFDAGEMSTSDTIDTLHSLQWLPVFVEDQSSDESPDIPLHSWPWSRFQLPSSLAASNFALFFSTGMQGYLYDMGPPVKHVVSYGYTSDCSMAVHTNSFLYAVTKSGLEAYTSRLYPLVAELCALASKAGETKTNTVTGGNAISLQEKCGEADRNQEKCEYKGYCYDPLQHDKEFFDSHSFDSNEENWFPGLPKYSQQTLLLPCPSTNLEFCLVGLFALHNIQFVGASSSFIGLLIKAKDKNDKHENTITPWSIYNLSKSPICDLYDELVALVEGNELSNPTVYHQLLCEGNLMLRSELTLGTPLKERIEFHLRLSARKIAEFLSRCDNNFDVSHICEYYSMAGITFKDAVISYMEQDASTRNVNDVHDGPKFPSKKTLYGHGMMLYLNSALFGNHEIHLEKELGDFILKVYLETQPSMLAKVILKSKLQNFSNDLAIKYMNKHKKKHESKGMIVNPFDCLCLAVLHMNVGNPNKAESLLGEISEESLQKICERHEFFLFDSQLQMTPFGQLVKKYFKSSLIVILVLMFDHGKLTVQHILDLFQEDTKDGKVSYSYSVCEILERLLNDNAHKKHYHKISLFMVDQYLFHISNDTLSTKAMTNNHKHVPKGNGHFAARFAWLNNMEPFTGEPTLSDECKLNNSPALRARNKVAVKVNCACCCCNEILLKLQSLLSSRHNRKELSSRVLSKLSEVNFIGRESLMLLCWPKADSAQEAVECIVGKHPKQCLQYARDMFDWKAQWQLLLQYVLSVLKNNEYEQWNHDAYLTLLKGVLLRLARAYTPAEFLTFLPEDGMASFFLPYVHECWEFYKSTSLKQQFLDTHKIYDE